MQRLLIILFVFSTMIIACNSKKKLSNEEQQKSDNELVVVDATHPLIIYKTKGDYSDFVPVILSEDKQKIVSFPDPTDLYFHGELAKPVNLSDGYLLDVRGIGPNVAFTSITYETYAAMSKPPSIEELLSAILDSDPIVELYVCSSGVDHEKDIQRINKYIEEGKLDEFCEKK